ncbi:MAG: MoaF N-terminal domain-containing protein [Armatimonadetes bacterium]|nr:MoaF N-terminal domain-containing protein [Armatimonadota bacterium]
MPDPARWISVGALAQAFASDNNAPPPTDDLAGRSLILHLENGEAVEYRFTSGTKLTRNPLSGSREAETPDRSYTATKVRDAIYFVDVLPSPEETAAESLVLDLGLGIATVIVARLPDEGEARRPLLDRVARGEELTAVAATFVSAAVDAGFTSSTERHLPTTELVGRRVQYTYSPSEQYEHIYLNDRFYTWHCLRGSEKGLADTDRCHYHKLADDLFLFVWREKIVPTVGVVVVDLRAMQTVGKIFGYEGGDFAKVSNFRVGARVRL